MQFESGSAGAEFETKARTRATEAANVVTFSLATPEYGETFHERRGRSPMPCSDNRPKACRASIYWSRRV